MTAIRGARAERDAGPDRAGRAPLDAEED